MEQKNGMGYITFGVAVWSNLVLIVCRTEFMPICQEQSNQGQVKVTGRTCKKYLYWLHLCNLNGTGADIACGTG